MCFQSIPTPGEVAGSAAPAVRILLVDDHADTNRSMSLLLGRRGYRVQTAASLADAEAFCAAEPFDVLVCDMNLPDGNGLELLGRLAAHPPRLGAIIVSGYSSEEDVERSLAAGYGAHLAKPVALDQLEATIRHLRR